MRSIDELRILQALPLDLKVAKTKLRIREWVNEFGVEGVYVAFSGGKDSTVLLHIVRQLYPNVEAVFVNTGLEYPEIQRFAKSFDNVTVLRPKMRFDEVIKKYGYPLLGKEIALKIEYARKGSTWAVKCVDGTSGKDNRYNIEKYKHLVEADFLISSRCCSVMKKAPLHDYAKRTGKVSITAQTADESALRTQQWLKNGCNGFDMKAPISNPMSFWVEQDVLQYIKQNNLPMASVYGEVVYAENAQQLRLCDQGESLKTTGCDRTGCIFCGFGCHLEKSPTRFQKLKETHPRQYEYCIGGGEFNEDGIWQPNKQGLGMGYVFEQLNAIYGEDFIKYK